MSSADIVKITLPDGKVLELPRGSTPMDVAQAIGPGLAKAALAAKIDDAIVDIRRPLESDARIAIITSKSPEALDMVRHSAAHVLATAVRQVRPDAKIGFGPSIDTGFYYDFEIATPFTHDELEKIEAVMNEV